MRPRLTAVMMTLCCAPAVPAAAQDTQNAALGYWMAFAQMKEPPSGSFGPDLIDANAAALATLRRASRGGFCDWGIDYELGPNAPIAHLPKARALAQLNSAAAVQSISRGQSDEAVAAWVTGMRFALHIESGGTLSITTTPMKKMESEALT